MNILRRIVVNLMIFGVTLALVLSVLVLLLARWQAQMLVHPMRFVHERTPADVGLSDYQTLTLTTSDGVDLAAWYVPPPQKPGGAIIYLHGISARRDQLLSEGRMFHDLGYGALFLDFRNHGESSGEVTTMGVLEVRDVRAALDYLLAQPEIDRDRIAIFGNSLGASTGLLAAAEMPEISAVLALSPYSSLLGVVGDRAATDFRLPKRPPADLVLWFAGRLSGTDLYAADPLAVIDQIAPRPILLIHGKRDTTTPYTSSERLIAAAGENTDLWILEDAGHGDFFYWEPDAYIERITTFFVAALGDGG